MSPSFLHPITSRWVFGIKFAALLLAGLFLLQIANHNFVLMPRVTSAYKPGNSTSIIRPASTSTLVRTANPDLPWRITTDTLPVTVTIPRVVESVRIQGELLPGTQPYVTFTAQGLQGYTWTNIVSSKFLDSLPWKHITGQGLTLWMRDSQDGRSVQQYTNVDQFFAGPPDVSKVGSAGIDPMAFSRVNTYKSSGKQVKFSHVFRGPHTLYLYAQDEAIDFALKKVDLNRQPGKDELTLRVTRADAYREDAHEWLASVTTKDDGDVTSLGRPGSSQPVQVHIPNVQPGLYRVEIVTNEDVVFTELTSTQSLLAFWGKVWFADGPAYGLNSFSPIELETNAGWLTLSPSHAQGKQLVSIGDHTHSLQVVKKTELVNGLVGTTAITLPRGDAVIASNMLIALKPAELIPAVSTSPIDLSGEVATGSYDYIVAPYTPRKEQTIVFDREYALEKLFLQKKDLHFTLHAPGLEVGNKTLGLAKLRVTFYRGPFPWTRVWHRLHLLAQ